MNSKDSNIGPNGAGDMPSEKDSLRSIRLIVAGELNLGGDDNLTNEFWLTGTDSCFIAGFVSSFGMGCTAKLNRSDFNTYALWCVNIFEITLVL